jgi:hypothetical protein
MQQVYVCEWCGHGGYATIDILRKTKKCSKCKKPIDGRSNALEPHHKIDFGKHAGTMLMDVPKEYLLWVNEQPRVSKKLKFYIQTVIL